MNILRNNNNYNKINLNKNKTFLIVLFSLLYYVNCIELNTTATTTPTIDLLGSTTPVVIMMADLTDRDTGVHVATTPKISVTKPLSRYEQGLDDYEEAVDRIEKEEDVKKAKVLERNSPFMAFIDLVGDAWINYRKTPRKLEGKADNSTDNLKGDTSASSSSSQSSTAVGEGRASYIKGDPLNGYYDFVITEGSYKFWSAFQLATAVLIIYSTFAAIYYSKVNPLTGDYDYTDYLSRSFNGRSLSDNDVDDGSNGGSYFSSVFNGNWMGTASHTFQYVMDAIDRVPE